MTTARRAKPPTKKFPLIPVVFGVAAIALIAIIVLTFEEGGGGTEVGSPDISGDSLPRMQDAGPDAALGLPAPEVEGADFDDVPVSITNDGRAKVIVFLAHWCPSCQREVPIVQDWLDATTLPPNVDFYSVATGISRTRENYPPSAWLEREGWTPPVLVDDDDSSVGSAYGLNAYPFWAFVAADGRVMARVTGGVAPSDLDGVVAVLAEETAG